ncbi:type VI secretion system contractile sheath large subunit [Atlantibacter hermannii]|uniref:type VI secretion system contractile sheath large subunit n=1 Tax=Atlantibacter hermannii TaxID=565 RepID=UPI00193206BB|nr:type VI secretion system contractile sheath large subunit [Atlantibacter hermannii]MBL7634230.1 type VI secretion system contractile sheath large subunit [Atlantibacter hermannii]MBL7674687.1 type VI secretion system contractile sheath large subunit [Atlantibacter hermannii]
MLMSVNNENATAAPGQTTVVEHQDAGGVYASLFEKINLSPVSGLSDINIWQDDAAMADASADERVTAAVQVLLQRLKTSGQQVGKLDKTLLDHHIAELDFQISRQLDAVMHHEQFQAVESLWRGLKHLVDRTDYRQNVRTEILDVSKDALRQDFEDAPEIIQTGLYWHTYVSEYDQPGGEPIGAIISAYEFDASAQDVALMRNISKVSAAAHMPFIGSAGPKFFLKDTMEEVAAIKDIGNYFDRAEYIKWKSFRETDDSRYIGLVMPRVLGRLPYGPDTVPVRSFNYVEEVKGPDHEKYLWTNASFAFAANMVRSFINNGWCVQIRGPQAGGAVQDLPIHLYDLGTGNQVKIPSEVLIPETREFEFANLGFIPLSYYKNRDYACFFSANSTQKPALYDTADATANSRINARLPYIFLLSRIAHYLKLIQRENIGTTKDRRLLELELNTWVKSLVTEMTDPGDELQASHPLRDAKVIVQDIEDNPGFFRVQLFAVPHFQVEGMDVNLSLVSRMPKAKA